MTRGLCEHKGGGSSSARCLLSWGYL